MKPSVKNKLPLAIMVGPTLVWMLLFVMVPLCYVISISFLSKNSGGGVSLPLSVGSYAELSKAEFLKILYKSLVLSLETTALCLVLGYPFAYIITRTPPNYRKLLVMLIMLPFWINSVIRIYGWQILLREEGVFNDLLMMLGVIKKPLSLLYTDGAVLLGMVYELLPFTVLPLYTSIEKLDGSLVEAARDLGATQSRVFRRVIFPLTMPGIFAGSIQTFIPSLGLFYISEMLGGGTTVYIGNVIKNQFLSARNWPLGAALSILLIVITLVLLRLYTKVGNLEDMA